MLKIRRGLDVPISGAPKQEIEEGGAIRSVAVQGPDFIGMKPAMEVRPGDTVQRGQTLFCDRRYPEIRFSAPAGGEISAVHRGAKRTLLSVVIDIGKDEARSFASFSEKQINLLAPERVEEMLLESGLWCAFRTRPYSHIPVPGTRPKSLFVNVMESEPLGVNPQVIIDRYKEELRVGLLAISGFSKAYIYVCCRPGTELDMPPVEGMLIAEFDGPHPAGLSGTHIHFLEPASTERTLWSISYQDVIAIGEFLLSGALPTHKVISLAGPQVLRPRLVRTRYGASIEELCAGELKNGENRLISGSVLSGRKAHGALSFLGRYHRQVSVVQENRRQELLGWLSPGLHKHSNLRLFASSFLFGKKKHLPLDTSRNGSLRAMVPTGNFERVMPLDILPTHLLRYLIIGDTEMAQQLGCLELDEEDLALCSYVCSGKYEYGPILRENLERIWKEG